MADTRYYGQPRIRDCCGGMGIVHCLGWGGVRASNPFYFVDIGSGNMAPPQWPCWAVPYYENPPGTPYLGQAVVGAGLKAEWQSYPYHLLFHYLGYNTRTGTMINSYAAGQVCSLELRGCHVDTTGSSLSNQDGAVPGYEGGISPNFSLFESDSDGPDFLASLLEYVDAGGDRNWAAWSGATNDRLYGHTATYDGDAFGNGDYRFKLWSVKYDLTDYQESLDLDVGTIPGDQLIAIANSHVADQKHFTVAEKYLDNEIDVYEDGSKIATMSPHTVLGLPLASLVPSINLGGAAVGVVKEQRLLVRANSTGFGGSAGYVGSLTIVEDGADPDDNQVYLALLEDHPIAGVNTRYYYPVSIAWDPDKLKTVVCWMPRSAMFGSSAAIYWSGFMTYIHEPLEPGNILEQMDKITLYMNWPCPGYGQESFFWNGGFGSPTYSEPREAPRERGVVIPGTLPPPMKVTPGEGDDPPTVDLPPTPPEPPPEPTCDGITECDTNQATFWNTGFENYTAITTDVGIPFGDLFTEVFGENLNFVAAMPDYEGGGLYSKVLVPLDGFDAPILGDYANPGLLIRRRKPTDAPYTLYTREDWAYKVYWQTECVDGYVRVTAFYYDRQTFDGDDGSTFPTYIGTDTGIAPGDLDSEEYAGGIVMGLCQSDYFQSRWSYSDVNEDGDATGSDPGPKYFWVMGILGVQPGEMPP